MGTMVAMEAVDGRGLPEIDGRTSALPPIDMRMVRPCAFASRISAGVGTSTSASHAVEPLRRSVRTG